MPESLLHPPIAVPPPPLRELRASHGLRLDAEEIAALESALAGIDAPVYLFGSRAAPHRRGGDIDLLILTDAPAFELSRLVATRFFARCEEKIDVIVMDPEHLSPEQRAFLDAIRAVRIH
jgi:predicted nucleotidyltransferase